MVNNKKFTSLKEEDLYLGRSNMSILPPFTIGIITQEVINKLNDEIIGFINEFELVEEDDLNLCLLNKDNFVNWWLDDTLKI